jgi:hypothetical protein
VKRFFSHVAVCGFLVLGLPLMTVAAPALAGTAKNHLTPLRTAPVVIDFADAIHADVGDSVVLPGGREVWDFGDATAINGKAVGFPHFELALHTPGTRTISVLPGHYGPGKWQQAPDFGGGDYFWPGAMAVASGNLFVWGGKIHGLGPKAAPVGEAVAEFSISGSTLRFRSLTVISSATESWGSAIPAAGGGFWLMGTHQIRCQFGTDCKIGDVARVPAGKEANPGSWTVRRVIPSGDNAGTVISVVPAAGGGFAAYTKQCDICGNGSLVEELIAPAMTGPWKLTSHRWKVRAPAHSKTYSLYAHPADSHGVLTLTYAVNGKAQYWLDQLNVPLP